MNDKARRYVHILALSEVRWRVALQAKRNVGYWPILLKNSASVSAAEKYAIEIEICAFWQKVQDSDFT